MVTHHNTKTVAVSTVMFIRDLGSHFAAASLSMRTVAESMTTPVHPNCCGSPSSSSMRIGLGQLPGPKGAAIRVR